jgi:hypothetical protein
VERFVYRRVLNRNTAWLRSEMASTSLLFGAVIVCVVSVCWWQLDFVPLSVVLGALNSLRLLSILAIHSVCYPRPCRL